MIGFAKIETTIYDPEDNESKGLAAFEIPSIAVIRKTDIESIHKTTRKGSSETFMTAITMRSGSEFGTYEDYDSVIKRLLPQQ